MSNVQNNHLKNHSPSTRSGIALRSCLRAGEMSEDKRNFYTVVHTYYDRNCDSASTDLSCAKKAIMYAWSYCASNSSPTYTYSCNLAVWESYAVEAGMALNSTGHFPL